MRIEIFCYRRLHSQPPRDEFAVGSRLSRAFGREAARGARP
jgi:hypothetical protein